MEWQKNEGGFQVHSCAKPDEILKVIAKDEVGNVEGFKCMVIFENDKIYRFTAPWIVKKDIQKSNCFSLDVTKEKK